MYRYSKDGISVLTVVDRRRKKNSGLGRCSGTVNEAIEIKMKALMAQGKVNSYYRYRSTLHGIERFGGMNISFKSVTDRWLEKCEAFWINEGKNNTTINIYMKTLQSVFNIAMEDEAIRPSDYIE